MTIKATRDRVPLSDPSWMRWSDLIVGVSENGCKFDRRNWFAKIFPIWVGEYSLHSTREYNPLFQSMTSPINQGIYQLHPVMSVIQNNHKKPHKPWISSHFITKLLLFHSSNADSTSRFRGSVQPKKMELMEPMASSPTTAFMARVSWRNHTAPNDSIFRRILWRKSMVKLGDMSMVHICAYTYYIYIYIHIYTYMMDN